MTTPLPTPEFLAAAAEIGVAFEPGELETLGRFIWLLLEANQTTNLTAITEPGEVWMRHIFDALTLVPVIASASEDRDPALGPVMIIDIGSGGGLPAIPLAAVMPDARFTLAEATGKKAAFLSHAARTLGLRNVGVLNTRAETLGQEHRTHREKYDFATARALGHLAVVAELCGPLVRPNGFVLAVKGAKAPQEVEEASKAFGLLGLRHAETVQTPTGRVVVLEKTTRTPRLYPRRDGEPSRAPLGIAVEKVKAGPRGKRAS
jgi:16S rRNA (guanine527-N7)-methyltransferase